MSKPQLLIDFEPGPWPGEEYRNSWPVGGRVRGTLHIDAPDPQRARNVRAELHWYTMGRGTVNRESPDRCIVHEGDLPGGPRLSRPFELAVPANGPITYDGQLIQIRWEVKAVIDIPWGVDVSTSLPINVLPDYDTE